MPLDVRLAAARGCHVTNQPNRPGRPPERASRPIPRQPGGGGTYGSASVRPATPPAKPTRNRKNGRSPLWTKLVIILGALIMLGSGTVYATFKVGEHELNKALPETDMSLGDAAAPPLTGKVKDGPLNILIVGVDASGERTDSIIIAHVPATHDKLYLVSLPRDTQVRVPSGGTNKINSTFNSGMGNLAKTIKLNYGITFNAALAVNFDGFKDLVTKLGGVTQQGFGAFKE